MKPLLLFFLLVLLGIQLSHAFLSTYNFHQPVNPLRRLRPMTRDQRAQLFDAEQYPHSHGAKRGFHQQPFPYNSDKAETGGDIISFQDSKNYFPWGII